MFLALLIQVLVSRLHSDCVGCVLARIACQLGRTHSGCEQEQGARLLTILVGFLMGISNQNFVIKNLGFPYFFVVEHGTVKLAGTLVFAATSLPRAILASSPFFF